jgi:hypothetical protein
MPEDLNIFLSYKMPKEDEQLDIAREFAGELSDLAGGRMKMHYAGAYPRGVDWRGEIVSTIKKSDMFILLYTGEEQQWEFCLLEAGLFQATHPTHPLVVLHHPSTLLPVPLANLNAVKVTPEHIENFLTPIFYDEPWQINPQLRRDTLRAVAQELVRIFHSTAPDVTNFDLVPSFTLEMVASDTTRSQLRDGKLPEKTTLKGAQGWQMLFDKTPAIASFKWGELAPDWAVKDLYDLKFSRMVLSATKKNTPGGCFIRPSIPGQGGTLYRVALRRYEEYANGMGWRFYFTAAPIDIPIFGIGDTADTTETTNYHLLNVCWYTRRKLILTHYKNALGLATDANATSEQKSALVADIKDELANIDIQSFIRRIHQPAAINGLMPLAEVRNDQTEWIRNTSVIDAYKTDADFEKVIEALAVMKAMNEKYYAASSWGFALSVATELGLPVPPISPAPPIMGRS